MLHRTARVTSVRCSIAWRDPNDIAGQGNECLIMPFHILNATVPSSCCCLIQESGIVSSVKPGCVIWINVTSGSISMGREHMNETCLFPCAHIRPYGDI